MTSHDHEHSEVMRSQTMGLGNVLHAESLKLRRSRLAAIHVAAGLVAGLFCGGYFAVAAWDTRFGADAFIQLLGAAMPFMVALVCALAVDTEREAGGMANLLALPSRRKALLGKLLLLFVYGLAAVLLAVFVFAMMLAVRGRNDVPPAAYAMSMVGIMAGSVPLYALFMVLAMRFGRNASIGAGVLGSLAAVASLGGLAHGLVAGELTAASGGAVSAWFPFAWPAHLGSLSIERSIAESAGALPNGFQAAVQANILSCTVVSLVLVVLVFLWIERFEDHRRSAE